MGGWGGRWRPERCACGTTARPGRRLRQTLGAMASVGSVGHGCHEMLVRLGWAGRILNRCKHLFKCKELPVSSVQSRKDRLSLAMENHSTVDEMFGKRAKVVVLGAHCLESDLCELDGLFRGCSLWRGHSGQAKAHVGRRVAFFNEAVQLGAGLLEQMGSPLTEGRVGPRVHRGASFPEAKSHVLNRVLWWHACGIDVSVGDASFLERFADFGVRDVGPVLVQTALNRLVMPVSVDDICDGVWKRR